MNDHDCHYYGEEIEYSETGLPFRVQKVCCRRLRNEFNEHVPCTFDSCSEMITSDNWERRLAKAIEESRRLIL